MKFSFTRTVIIVSLVIIFISSGVTLYLYFSQKKGPSAEPLGSFTFQPEENRDNELIRYVNPQENISLKKGEELTVSASASSDAVLFAVVGSLKLPMICSNKSLDGYGIFTAAFKIDLQPGSYTVGVEATKNSVSQVAYGGALTVTEGSESPSLPDYISGGIKGDFTPDIKIIGGFAEAREKIGSEACYNPEFGDLQAGTYEKVLGTFDTVDEGETKTMLLLSTGRAIKADSPVISSVSAGNIGLNSISLVSSAAGDKMTDVNLKMKYPVPFETKFVGQKYTAGYENLKFNVPEFTASAIDFVFRNTAEFTGENFTVNSRVISSGEIIPSSGGNTATLRIHLKRPGRFYGYSVKTGYSGDFVISFREPPAALTGMKILIDPGHGGNSGATNQSGDRFESTQVLFIGKHLANYLSSAGAQVYMTRTAEADVPLEGRRNMTEQLSADLMISIHLNSSDNLSASGTSTFYYNPYSMPLASSIHSKLVASLRSSCYSGNPEMYEKADQGIHYYPFFVTRTPVCPSVLVEVGYISNAYESLFLIDDAYQQLFAYSIYMGIFDYVAAQRAT